MVCVICQESSMKDPCALPCGHVHCFECTMEHVASSAGRNEEHGEEEDNCISHCPTCRSPYHIVIPDELPERYHRYVEPAMRRIYLANDSGDEIARLKAELQAAKERIQVLEQAHEESKLDAEHFREQAGKFEREILGGAAYERSDPGCCSLQ